MTNSYQQQQKALLVATLISLAIHGVIISALSGTGKGEKITLRKNTIKINLVEIKTKQEPIVAKPKPKEQLPKNQKKPQAIRQLKPRVERQTASQKPKGEPAKRKPSPQPKPIIDTGSQTSKEPAVAAIDKDTNASNASGSESINKSANPISSKESTSIIQKETPRCRQCREPRIPRRAEKRGEEGYASFRLYVNASGKVVKTQLLQSSGHASFINSAQKAAMSSTFYPMAQQNTIDIMYELKIK